MHSKVGRSIVSLLTGLLLLGTEMPPAEMDIVVFANGAGQSSISAKELRDIFFGDLTFWDNGKEIQLVFLINAHPDYDQVASEVMGWSGAQLTRHWLRLTFQGRAMTPISVETPEELQSFVSKNPGAVGVCVNRGNLGPANRLPLTN